MVYISGLMVAFIKEIGMKIKYLVTESIIGTMAELIRATGLIIICMDKEFINGQMAENMKVNT